ncbi:c-type cytochrome [Methylobacter svalbardensis]|uniref:c-type cytochrome n=1 Tax=Methylobacter svalbardensis TaxID=3080016 RepID=UPI0030EBA04B
MKRLYSLNLHTFFAIALTTLSLSVHAETLDVDAAKAFAKQNNCFKCHGTNKDKDGPAFAKIAAKFKDDPKAEEKILQHLISGVNVKFPDGHEEAHMILKSDDSKEINNLAAWILSF